jgi:hypothetical protein
MKYYLETNALYNLKKLSDEDRKQSFTSAFAIAEIIAGIDAAFYTTRRSILKQLESSGIFIEWTFPQEIVFDSFDAFEEYAFDEQRAEPLFKLYKAILRCEIYDEFVSSPEYTNENMGFDYFRTIDTYLSKNFITAAESFNTALKNDFIEKPVSELLYNDELHIIDSKKKMEQFLLVAPEVNRSTTIIALAKMINQFTRSEIQEKELYSSYNGLINPYVEVYSRYSAHKMGISGSPGRNDFQDLTHLMYLRNQPGRRIVSNDRLFKQYAEEFYIQLFEN